MARALPDTLSPSLVNDLFECKLRAVLLRDPATERRPTPASCLGLVSHELFERASAGEFDDAPPEDLPLILKNEWTEAIARRSIALGEAWPLAAPPLPIKWPGYQLTRVRLLRSLARQVEARQHASQRPSLKREGTSLKTEHWLRDPATGLTGRADRIEIGADGEVRIVDLKSGWTQDLEVSDAQRRQLLLYAYLWHAENATWPKEACVQLPDGRRASIRIEPEEALAVVTDAVAIARRVRDALRRGAPDDELASPSPQTCRHCPVRGICGPHLEAVNAEWQWHRQTVIGVVTSIEPADERYCVLHIRVQGGSLPPEIAHARLIDLPLSQTPDEGVSVVLIDAAPMSDPADLRVSWRTQLLLRER